MFLSAYVALLYVCVITILCSLFCDSCFENIVSFYDFRLHLYWTCRKKASEKWRRRKGKFMACSLSFDNKSCFLCLTKHKEMVWHPYLLSLSIFSQSKGTLSMALYFIIRILISWMFKNLTSIYLSFGR